MKCNKSELDKDFEDQPKSYDEKTDNKRDERRKNSVGGGFTGEQSIIEKVSSKSSLSSSQMFMCRICHCEETSEQYLISPCYCAGTLRYVHQSCLQQWLKSNGMKSCELCKFDFIMQTKVRPLKKWKKLDMNRVEKRKIMCSVAFHLIAITCVVWSLYVLIERTADEIKSGLIEWPFWTKLVVVAIGFTGGVVFMYIQCKMYLQLCIRWKQYNRVILIQPITEDLLKKSKKSAAANAISQSTTSSKPSTKIFSNFNKSTVLNLGCGSHQQLPSSHAIFDSSTTTINMNNSTHATSNTFSPISVQSSPTSQAVIKTTSNDNLIAIASDCVSLNETFSKAVVVPLPIVDTTAAEKSDEDTATTSPSTLNDSLTASNSNLIKIQNGEP